MKVRLFKPSVGAEELANIKQVFDRAWMGLGPLVGEFEDKWTKYVNCGASLALNSGTAALHLALAGYGFKPGAKVLVPALTFVASAAAAMYNQLVPRFVDVDEATLGISLDDLERKWTPDCVAIVVVHFAGHPVPMERVCEFAKSKRLIVVEDCAHCAGGDYHGKKLGVWGDVGCFSFEEKKCMTTGDGGMLSSMDRDLVDRLRPQRWVGIDKDTWKRSASYADKQFLADKHWYYEISVLGYKFNMNDLCAAIGLAQLDKLDGMNARRREIIGRYLHGISELQSIRPLLPYDLPGSAYWIFGVRSPKRDQLIAYLKSREIATGVHYTPLPLQPLFRDHQEPTPIANRIWEEFVSLPLFPDLSNEEVDYVVGALKEFDRANA